MDSKLSVGIVIVDHGSRMEPSNRLLEEVARLFAERFKSRYDIVEPAHMEIAEPSIATAFGRCVSQGARRVVVCPYFLGPGKHWTQDIPRLTADAAAAHPGIAYHVTQTLGIDELILDLLAKRIEHCVGCEYLCEQCRGTLRAGQAHTA
jgi:sirohydrochlorin ferrochelatase